MTEFKAQRFNVYLQNHDSSDRQPVTVEVGLEGVKILSADEARPLRVYGLKNITRWEQHGGMLRLYTKTSSDIEERHMALSGAERTCQLLLDTLTSFYYLKTELAQGGSAGEFGADSSSQQLSSSRTRRRTSNAPNSDDIEFWVHPEKEGWMYSQGEHIKTWRRRYFVLKSGFLFRFLNSEIDASSKPRGIVDLSTVTDMTEGSSATGKQNSLKLSTATGYVCYLTDSETDLVEWLSALDKAHTEIVKRVAGVEDEVAEDRSCRGSKQRRDRSGDMVSVVGYDTYATAPPASLRPDISLNYGDVDGMAGVVETPSRPNPMVPVNYGPSTEIPQPSLYPNPVAPSVYVPHPYNGSILDQTPQQTPAYPSFQSISAPDYRMQVPLEQTNPWQVYYAPDGRVYYYNRSTGKTQWERPPELVM